jgi:hypothetical protein
MPDPFEILTSLGYTLFEKISKNDFVFIKQEYK